MNTYVRRTYIKKNMHIKPKGKQVFLTRSSSKSLTQARKRETETKKNAFTHEVRLYFSHIKMCTAVKIYAYYTIIVHSVKCTLP